MMANRKTQKDKVVRQDHMPRKNGPCKPSPDGFHKANVTSRTVKHVIEPRGDWLHNTAGIFVDENVACEYCGKRAMSGRRRMDSLDNAIALLQSGNVPTMQNGLDKVNDRNR